MINLPSKRSMLLMFALVALLSVVVPVKAEQTRMAPRGDVSFASPPSDLTELEAFLDEFFARKMEEYDIAGAAVSVVKDGKLFLAKGYGYDDLERGIPVDAEETIFLALVLSARCSPGRQLCSSSSRESWT